MLISMMECPKCRGKTDVINSRLNLDYNVVRRRRKCLKCGYRFTTYESSEFEKPKKLRKKKIEKKEVKKTLPEKKEITQVLDEEEDFWDEDDF